MYETIKNYLENYLGRSVDADESLISGGALDSLGALKLMFFLEKECGLNSADPYFDIAGLDSINDIMEILEEQK